ncbi:MAG: sensor domain-containing diguanylate cyclase [Candidatus Eisenbacteria bacterium]|uniref:Sensor domain-containing diguanylate cyclase n=1 Tax=Eiseniibacteriota bacterium TaxID=2212470 RepID=A0A956SBM7_UNCEI|nr:sensor domain-containing diguanylate cyclase [Candidatus Eisenbacteria bacterium]
MRRRNGNGSQQLQDITEKFRKGEAKLIKVLEDAGYLTERERASFLEKIDKAVAQKRSSEVLSTAHTLHNKIIRVLQASKGDSRPREGQELEILMEVSRLIQSTDQREEALDKLMELIRQVIPYQNGTLFVLNRASKQLVVGTVFGDHVDLIGGVAFDHGFGFSSWVAKQQKPILLNELHRTSRSIGPDIGSFLSVPLVVQQELVGVLNLSHPQNQAFTEEHLRLLTLIASQAAAILQRILMYEEMSRLAITDELTGLYNRRHFLTRLQEEQARAKRHGHEFSLLFLDIDDFKRINDTYGHGLGDRILAELGKLLMKWARSSDLLARFGGEEFVVLLPMTEMQQALTAAERLRNAVAEHSFPRRKRITVSVGVANYPHDADTTEDLIKMADQALYQAKRMGRNRSMACSLGAA